MFQIDPVSALLGFLLAVLCFLFILLWLRARWQGTLRTQQNQLASAAQAASEVQARLSELQSSEQVLKQNLQNALADGTAARQELEVEKTRLQERLSAFKDAEQRFAESFSHLSRTALKENSQSFLELASQKMQQQQQLAGKDLEARRKAVDDLVNPINQSMKKLEEQLQSVGLRNERAGATLKEQLEQITQGQTRLAGETDKLRQALRQPSVRGQWGEMQLKRVAELAGMLDHVDFHEQVSITAEDGSRLRPDMVIHMPGNKSIVVDAKAVMSAYLEASEAEDENTRREQMARHARQVRDHIQMLSSRSYWNSLENTPEFVIMFIPGEAFYSAALQEDPALIEFGSEKRVLLAGPTTLLALLKAASYGWQQEVMAENARQVAEIGKELHKRLATYVGHFGGIRKGLKGAVESYNRAVGSLEGMILPQSRRFAELGVPTKEEIPIQEELDTNPRETRPLPEPGSE